VLFAALKGCATQNSMGSWLSTAAEAGDWAAFIVALKRHASTVLRRVILSGGDVAPDCEAAGVLAGLGYVVGELHAEKVVHVWAEGFLDAQRHFRRERGLAVQQVGERGAAHFQNLRRLGDGEAESFDHFGASQIAGMGRVFHGHCVALWCTVTPYMSRNLF